MNTGIDVINQEVERSSAFVKPLFNEIGKVVIGQTYLVERLAIGLLANGHVLLEGVPGLAKTLSIKSLAACLHVKFSRIQFTPDMLPADVIGTQIYNPQSGGFATRKGPIFANLVLADEINRAPAKVQSALLEAMQEKQVTIGNQSYPLEEPFLVLATQNPIEQEGTYPLPEAQVDRFMLKLKIDYPSRTEERQILDLMARTSDIPTTEAVVKPEQILDARNVVNQIYMDEKVKDYIVDLVCATRDPEAYKIDLKDFIQLGASPRATIALTLAAKSFAFLRGRGYVTPQDVKSIGMDVLRHRVTITYEAEAEEKTSETIIQKIFDDSGSLIPGHPGAPPGICIMIPREILKKIRQIELRTNRLVNETLGGQYHSVFKGQGMNFEEVREYQPGDEVRSIDWNVTARMNHPFVKKFVEERELTVMLLVDISGSGLFGSIQQSKRELAAEIASVLAFSAIRNNDKVGLILFTDEVEIYMPPRKGRRYVLRVIREILFSEPKRHGTNIAGALEFLSRVMNHRSIAIVLSDFIENRPGSRWSGAVSRHMASAEVLLPPTLVALRQVNRRHDLVAVHLADRYELELPPLGRLVLKDAETGEVLEINTGDPRKRAAFARRQNEFREDLARVFRSVGIDSIQLRTDQPYAIALGRFFEMREKRRLHG